MGESKLIYPYRFTFNRRKYEVYESLIDYRTAKIYALGKDDRIIGEVTDDDRKYKLLQVARSILFDPILKV